VVVEQERMLLGPHQLVLVQVEMVALGINLLVALVQQE
jgi:hypothetical protein